LKPLNNSKLKDCTEKGPTNTSTSKQKWQTWSTNCLKKSKLVKKPKCADYNGISCSDIKENFESLKLQKFQEWHAEDTVEHVPWTHASIHAETRNIKMVNERMAVL
jgi:hypothetical protein